MSDLTSQTDHDGEGQSVAGQAQQKVQETAEEVRGQLSGRLRDQVDARSTQAGEQLVSVADAMRRTGQTLRDEGTATPAKVTDAVAERTDRLGSYLRESDADAILGDVENLARRRPWLFAAGGFAFGLIASRFLKASSGGRYQAQGDASRRRYVSSAERQPEVDVVFEPDVELEPLAGARHGA